MPREDFCFTYYDGDAARDKAHMSRLERGAYDDLISAQRKFGPLTLAQIKKVLSRDFEECWPSLEMVMRQQEDKFFIEWVAKSVEKMKQHAKKQKENSLKRWGNKNQQLALPPSSQTDAMGMPLEYEDEDGKENKQKEAPLGSEKVVAIANKVWGDLIWREQICLGQSIPATDLKKWMAQFNASVANDYVVNFDVGSYKKMLQGWIAKQKAKGRMITSPEMIGGATPLKKL